MPLADWNGKFQGVGNGGYAGTITYTAGSSGLERGMAEALRRGYATASTDTGHTVWSVYVGQADLTDPTGIIPASKFPMIRRAVLDRRGLAFVPHRCTSGDGTDADESGGPSEKRRNDLSRSRARHGARRGGKLLLYHGAPQTADWLRLFLAPGMGHCGGGEGLNTFDMVSALEQWVEKQTAPSVGCCFSKHQRKAGSNSPVVSLPSSRTARRIWKSRRSREFPVRAAVTRGLHTALISVKLTKLS